MVKNSLKYITPPQTKNIVIPVSLPPRPRLTPAVGKSVRKFNPPVWFCLVLLKRGNIFCVQIAQNFNEFPKQNFVRETHQTTKQAAC